MIRPILVSVVKNVFVFEGIYLYTSQHFIVFSEENVPSFITHLN